MGRSLFAILSLRPAHRHVLYCWLLLVVCSHAFIGSQLKKKRDISSNNAWERLNHKTKVVWIMDFKLINVNKNPTDATVYRYLLQNYSTCFGCHSTHHQEY